MRSLIILEVEHGEDTDAFDALAQKITTSRPVGEIRGGSYAYITDYTVRVDVPDCFMLDSE